MIAAKLACRVVAASLGVKGVQTPRNARQLAVLLKFPIRSRAAANQNYRVQHQWRSRKLHTPECHAASEQAALVVGQLTDKYRLRSSNQQLSPAAKVHIA